MNKTEFLSALERELSALPPEERRDAMHRLALRGKSLPSCLPRRQTGRRLPVNPPLQGLAPLQERVC